MIEFLKDIKFEEEYIDENDNVTLYFVAPKEILPLFGINIAPDDISAEIALEFVGGFDPECACASISPTKEVEENCTEDYDWNDIDLSYNDVEELMRKAQSIKTPYGIFSNLEVTPYNEETYVLASLPREEGYSMLGFDAPVSDDNVWRFWVELGYMDGSTETHSVELSEEERDIVEELHFLYKKSLIPKTKVAIADLRGNDAWNYDWILAKAPVEAMENTHDAAYKDACGDYVLFDGTEEEAYCFYLKFCEKNNLQLIGYDTMVKNFDESEKEFGEYKITIKGLATYSGYAKSKKDAIYYAMDCFKYDDEFYGTEATETVTEDDCKIVAFSPN